MDFSDEELSQQGSGTYTRMDLSQLPPLHIMYATDIKSGSDSGRVHADVRQRWLEGDDDVHDGMEEVAACAKEGR